MQIRDPRIIPQSEEPLIVLANQTNSWIGQAIDWRTDIKGIAPMDHAMLSINEGKFVTQGLTYAEVPMSNYLITGSQLTFVQLVNSSPDFIKAFSKSVQKRLMSPPWHKWYDFLGIVGQAIGAPWIHTPGLEYCSVDVIRHLVNACPYLPKEDQMVINAIPRETNPEVFYDIILKNPKTFFIYGNYDSDHGVVV